MDLHTVADFVEDLAIEANKAIHAGHPETSYKYFKTIMEQIRTLFNEMSPNEVAALAETTSEKPAETQTEKPVEVPGAQIRPAAVVPEKLAQQAHQVPESQIETR